MTQKCRQCGKEFTLTESEIEFYKKKGLQLPKRCKACRESNKAADSKQSASSATKGTTQATAKSTTQKGKITPLRIVAGLVVALAVFFFGDSALQPGDGGDVGQPSTSTVQQAGSTDTSQGGVDASGGDISGGIGASSSEEEPGISLTFRSAKLLNQHYEKHGIDMGFSSAEEYEQAASAVTTDENVLHKTEAEDGDDVYYIEDTNEFVVVSSDGYLRTYFYPSGGKNYYDRQ